MDYIRGWVLDENCLGVKDLFLIRKMDFGKGALNPSYDVHDGLALVKFSPVCERGRVSG
jgi:hypothetical protein